GQLHIADEELKRDWRVKEFHHGAIVRSAHIIVELESSVREDTNERVNGRGIFSAMRIRGIPADNVALERSKIHRFLTESAVGLQTAGSVVCYEAVKNILRMCFGESTGSQALQIKGGCSLPTALSRFWAILLL